MSISTISYLFLICVREIANCFHAFYARPLKVWRGLHLHLHLPGPILNILERRKVHFCYKISLPTILSAQAIQSIIFSVNKFNFAPTLRPNSFPKSCLATLSPPTQRRQSIILHSLAPGDGCGPSLQYNPNSGDGCNRHQASVH